ncbi:MAG: hypothetical protein ACI4IT_01255 [Oscillospiraceae bacterium]
MRTASKVVNFIFGHTGEPVKYPRICNSRGLCIINEVIHCTHFGCELSPLRISLNFSTFCFVKTCGSERTIGVVEILISSSNVCYPVCIRAVAITKVGSVFVMVTKLGEEDVRDFFGSKCKCHYLKLINSKLLFDIEDGAGVIKVKYYICIFSAAVGSDEIIDSLLYVGSESSFSSFGRCCIFCFELFDLCCMLFSISKNYRLVVVFNFRRIFLAVVAVYGFVVAGASGERENHNKSEKQCEKFFHNYTPYN